MIFQNQIQNTQSAYLVNPSVLLSRAAHETGEAGLDEHQEHSHYVINAHQGSVYHLIITCSFL